MKIILINYKISNNLVFCWCDIHISVSLWFNLYKKLAIYYQQISLKIQIGYFNAFGIFI